MQSIRSVQTRGFATFGEYLDVRRSGLFAERNYQNAIAILDQLHRPRGHFQRAPDDPSDSRNNLTLRGRPNIHSMKEWLLAIGHSVELDQVNRLNIIHVAGTKGKGSTCAYAEALLRTHGRRTGFPRRTGLFTSPALTFPEDRIRLNFEPISTELFTKYFFEVWEALCEKEPTEYIPRYVQLSMLISVHTFLREGVDAAVFETNIGGEYDSTNVITKPIVTAITSLGMDHVAMLGPTIEDIAWHKAGIMKPGASALSAPQDPRPAAILQQRAHEKCIRLQFIDTQKAPESVQPKVQRINASLAIEAVHAFLAAENPKGLSTLTSEDIETAVKLFKWPGRFHRLTQGDMVWFLDSAHNELSMSHAADWFAKQTYSTENNDILRVLIFNQSSVHRNGTDVLECLAAALQGNGVQFDHIIFTTYARTSEDLSIRSSSDELKAATKPPEHYPSRWLKFDEKARIHMLSYISDAVGFAKALGGDKRSVHVLVTGSLNLVGSVLNFLERPIQ